MENVYPTWLTSSKGEHLELDFFIDKLSIAVEVQGRQHLEFTPFFHATEHDFSEQLRRDTEKKDLCNKTGVRLLYIYGKSDVEIILYEIYAQVQKQLDTQEDIWPDGDSENLKAIFFRETTNLVLQKRYKKKFNKLTPTERQVFFDKVICGLRCSLDDVTSMITPRKARQKLELITYCTDRNYTTVSSEQSNVIARARKRSRQ